MLMLGAAPSQAVPGPGPSEVIQGFYGALLDTMKQAAVGAGYRIPASAPAPGGLIPLGQSGWYG
jgi:hypothetical protein